MNLSDGEKLILMMLSDINRGLDLKSDIDPEFIQEAIRTNNVWAIPWKYSGIPFNSQDEPEIVNQILKILDMWSNIESSFDMLTFEEKNSLKNNSNISFEDTRFKGFYGNEESEYILKASFIINRLNRFEEFKERDLDSHYSTLHAYEKMLSVLDKNSESYRVPFSKDELINLLNSQKELNK